jgi:hypothetical protein
VDYRQGERAEEGCAETVGEESFINNSFDFGHRFRGKNYLYLPIIHQSLLQLSHR